jgi:hypothetical protein
LRGGGVVVLFVGWVGWGGGGAPPGGGARPMSD